MGFFGLFKNKTREEAIRLGITVTEINREVPIFAHGNKLTSLKPYDCVAYSLPRTGGTEWKLLQRDEAHGAQLPSGYLLEGSHTTTKTLEKFKPIAEKYSEEYFEFEGTKTHVFVYWEEWGGAKMAQEIYDLLQNLKDF